MQKWLSVIALCVSFVAIVLSGVAFYQTDARAERAVQRREKVLVEALRQDVERFCTDFGTEPVKDPQTLDELLGPLFNVTKDLSGASQR